MTPKISDGASCIFCKIITTGEIPATEVFADAHVYAFLDISPVHPGHTLVVPRKHYENIHDLPDEILCSLFTHTKRIATAVKTGVGADGINIVMNNGKGAGQVVPHAHVHIIPRYENDGFYHWKGRRGYGDGEMRKVAEKIKAKLQNEN